MFDIMRTTISKRLAFLMILLCIISLSILPSSNPVQTKTLTGTIVVTSRTNSGAGSLREALTQAQAGDTITFDTTVFPPTSPMTITLLSALPTLTQGNVTIDASNAGVVLDGQYASDYADGLRVTSDRNAIKGLTILNFPSNGIEISSSARYNVIGGDFTVGSAPRGEGNILTANGDCGVVIEGTGTMSNTVSGNLIGLDVDGTWDWRVRALVVSPNYAADQTIFIGTRHHGVWRSTDDGAHWNAANTGLTQLDVRALVISPDYATDHIIFAGTKDGEIFLSTDSGATWIQTYDGAVQRDIFAMSISPNFANDGHVFATTDGKGVLVSTDGGETWDSKNKGITDYVLHDVEASPNYAVDKTVWLFGISPGPPHI